MRVVSSPRSNRTQGRVWSITGDVTQLDDEGFITITDRLSRFSKVAGEMVTCILRRSCTRHSAVSSSAWW
jgi:acyl-CoA synthetase (AMP-forming)/AMP-acid ligase II